MLKPIQVGLNSYEWYWKRLENLIRFRKRNNVYITFLNKLFMCAKGS